MGKTVTVALPDIGEGVVEGEVVEWLKNVGDSLKQDEPVVVVMTDKATVELPATYPGKLIKQYRAKGEIAYKDKPLYDIEIADEQKVTEEKKNEPKAAVQEKKAPSLEAKKAPPAEKATPSGKTEKLETLALPAVRHLAQEMGIDIEKVKGTGKEGRITIEDLKSFTVSTEKKEKPVELSQSDDEEVILSGIPLLMAKKMTESKKQIPHFSYFEPVDATRLVQLRTNFKQEGLKKGIQITYMPFLIRALSMTLAKYPRLNSSLDVPKNSLHIHLHHHIGIAMSTHLGLIVPVLKNVETMDLNAIIYAYDELKQKALKNRLQSSDMKEGTVTISNFGITGSSGQWATPIINFPEVAILAVSRVEKEPIARNEEVAVRDILHLSWSFDHRIIDGDLAATASHYYATLIQNPASLL